MNKALLLLTICVLNCAFIKSYPSGAPACAWDYYNLVIDSTIIDLYNNNGTTPGTDFFWCDINYGNFIHNNSVCAYDSSWCRNNVSHQAFFPDEFAVMTYYDQTTPYNSTPNPGYTGSVPNIFLLRSTKRI